MRLSMGKTDDKPIDPDIKPSGETRKLITRQERRLYYWVFIRLTTFQKLL